MPRRVLFTGGHRGIGRAIAEGLIAKGLGLTIGARNLADGESTADQIGADAITLDVLTLPDVDLPRGYDILINNAGILLETPIFADPEGFHTSMDAMGTGP